MKKYLSLSLLIATVLFLGCGNKKEGNKKLDGKWFYTEAAQSYLEFNGSTCTDYMGEVGATVKYNVAWIDSLHYELTVKEVTGLAGQLYSIGDKLQVEVKELTKDYYRFYITGKHSPQCIVVVRQQDYKGGLGTPC